MNPSTPNRRRILGAAAAFAVPLLSAFGTEPQAGNEAQVHEVEEHPAPDWKLLDFLGDRKLREIRVKLAGRKSEQQIFDRVQKGGGYGYNPSDEAVEGVVVDGKLLRFASSCLYTVLVQPKRFSGWGGTGKEIAVGEVVLVCDKEGGRNVEREEVKVLLTTVGAMLDCKPPAVTHVFYSWGFAKLLDDFIFERTKGRMSADSFQILSGESMIASHKRRYEELANEKP